MNSFRLRAFCAINVATFLESVLCLVPRTNSESSPEYSCVDPADARSNGGSGQWPRGRRRKPLRRIRVMLKHSVIGAVALLFTNVQAQTSPLSLEAMYGFGKTGDDGEMARIVAKSNADLESIRVQSPNRKLVAALFFEDGVSVEQLLSLEHDYQLSVQEVEAKLPVSDGTIYTVAFFALGRFDASTQRILEHLISSHQSRLRQAISAAPATSETARIKNELLNEPFLMYKVVVIGDAENLSSIAQQSGIHTFLRYGLTGSPLDPRGIERVKKQPLPEGGEPAGATGSQSFEPLPNITTQAAPVQTLLCGPAGGVPSESLCPADFTWLPHPDISGADADFFGV